MFDGIAVHNGIAQGLLKEASSELTATKELVSIAQRARKLMSQQSQIDMEVAER